MQGPKTFLEKVKAKKILRTSVLPVSAGTISSIPQQVCVFVIYIFASDVAFLVALDVPCQFQVRFGFPSSTLYVPSKVSVFLLCNLPMFLFFVTVLFALELSPMFLV